MEGVTVCGLILAGFKAYWVQMDAPHFPGGHTGIVMIMMTKLHFLVPVELKLSLLQTFAGLRLPNFLFFN